MIKEDTRDVFRRMLCEGLPSGFLDGSKFKGTLFHGSSQRGLKRLHPDVGDEYGIYLSPQHRYARKYGSRLYSVRASIKRPFVVKDKSEISPADLTKEDVKRIQAKGYDAIVSTSSTLDRADEVVVFTSNQVYIIGEKSS